MKVKEILEKPRVQNRITALALAKGRSKQVSREVFEDMIIQNYQAAFDSGDFVAANKALEILGKAKSFLIDQRQTFAVTANMNKPVNGEDQSDRIKALAEIAGINLQLPPPRDPS